MTTDFYPLVIGFALTFLTVVGCLMILSGWFLGSRRGLRRSPTADEWPGEGLPLVSPGPWGEPDLAPSSTSAAARAKAAQLEELWRLPARRRSPAD